MPEETLQESLIGQRIRLPGHFDQAVGVEGIRSIGNGVELRVRLANGQLEELVVTQTEYQRLLSEAARTLPATTFVDPERLRLLVESARIHLAYAHDRQFAVSLSGIRTLPHQIEAVYQRMLPQPQLRFLLADDPGAGKTIMAGLLVKELKLREAIDRVLILCPAPLTIQWQDEMLRWFGEPFDIIFAAVDQQQLTNPWQRVSQAIVSIDYAKQVDVRERIWQQRWDLVIIDEAHKCSARTHSGGKGREPKVDATKRYELAQHLTHQANHVLLLTATPHHGDEDKFAHFLRLLDPDLFPEPHRLGDQTRSIHKNIFRLGKDCPWALRRLKEDLTDANGHRLFPDRHVKTVTFCLNGDEYAQYKAVTAYINQFMPQQTGQRRTSVALARTVFQRRLASSTCAIHESLKRRLSKQEEFIEQLEAMTPAQRAKRLAAIQGSFPDAEQDDDDLDDATRDQLFDEFTASQELEQLRAEVTALKDLVEQARRVREQASDSKLAALKRSLGEAQFAELKDGRGKLLIFTEHRATLVHVRQHLETWGYSTCEIHGGMNPRERKQAQEDFRTKAQVCVATEAAGEGINLQFCHLMINYDMPWNPTRLEQRLGRIHRIGQERDVYAFNFVATDSEEGQPIIEGRILHRLLEKLEQMKEALEGRVFDVIGEVLSLNDINLPEMLREAAYDPRRLDEYISQIDRIDPEKLKQYEEAIGIALARANVDFSAFQKQNLEVEERRLMPRYVEAHFISAAKEVGLRIEPRADGLWRIDHVLADLRSDRLQSVRKLGKPDVSYRKVTFHKYHLEQDAHLDAVILGPGHPLYAAVDESLNERLKEFIGQAGLYLDPLATAMYRLHFFEMTVRGQNSHGASIPLYGEVVAVKEEGGQYEIVPADLLLNLPPAQGPAPTLEGLDPTGAADYLKSNYQLQCRAQAQQEREQFANVCRQYLLASFDARVRKAQERAMQLGAQAAQSPDYQRAYDESRKVVEDLGRTRAERLTGLDRLIVARTGPIRHLATAVVLTIAESQEAQLESLADELDPNTRLQSEKAAEDRAIAFEEQEGWTCQRVGHLKLGFDVRSHKLKDAASGEIAVRRIEVKGRLRGQPIRLTTNEWYKAQQLGESYWLYVVWDPLGPTPELVRIQNPAVKLDHAKREIVAARFYEIPGEAIK